MDTEEDYGANKSVNPSTQQTHQDSERKKSKRITQGAAIVGGITGVIVAGPVLGIIGAVGAAVVASQNNGVAGDIVRASGGAIMTVGDTAKEIDGKYRVIDKSKTAVGNTMQKTVPLVQKTGNMIGKLFKTNPK